VCAGVHELLQPLPGFRADRIRTRDADDVEPKRARCLGKRRLDRSRV